MRSMDGISLPLLAALAVVTAGAGTVLWQQRRLMADLKRQLSKAEDSRRELAERLRDLTQHMQSQVAAAAPTNNAEERKRALERALDAVALNPAGDFPWLETLPHENEELSYQFAATQADVDLPLTAK
jgi:uncharacterized sporulation protein YeaH/YhbH (DUF444 family)